jgi:hypothetical protein
MDQTIPSYDELQIRLDEALDGRFDKDARKKAEVVLALCDLVRSEFDSAQLLAVRAAKDYWNSNLSEEERAFHLKQAWDRIGKEAYKPIVALDRRHVLDRLVVCSLITNGDGLSITLAEFLLELAEALGLSASDVAEAFSRHLPHL